jgi:competence protein ComGC
MFQTLLSKFWKNMQLEYNKSNSESGLSLVELSISLIIITILIGIFLQATIYRNESENIKLTNKKIQEIEKAIGLYILKNKSLPCPAPIAINVNNPNFGVEFKNASGCSNTSTGIQSSSYPNMKMGAVPTKTLNLPDEMAFDPWNKFITYLVIEECTFNKSQNPTKNLSNNANCGANSTMIIRSASNSLITNQAVTALISHGKHGHGAYMQSGSRVMNSAGVDEIENAHSASGDYNNIFIQRGLSDGVGNRFDHIARYRTQSQIILFSKLIPSNDPICQYASGVGQYLAQTICGTRVSNSKCRNKVENPVADRYGIAPQIRDLCL